MIELVVSIVVVFAAAIAGSLFTAKPFNGWYAGLKKPPFTPPNWAFGPVWTALYIMMAAAVYLVWQQGLNTEGVFLPFILFWIQLVFNVAWSAVFFGMKSPGGGVFVIAVLWLLILATIIASFPVSLPAGILLIPYIVWVTLASYLNIGIWLINRKV